MPQPQSLSMAVLTAKKKDVSLSPTRPNGHARRHAEGHRVRHTSDMGAFTRSRCSVKENSVSNRRRLTVNVGRLATAGVQSRP